jgi:hypothetical protein
MLLENNRQVICPAICSRCSQTDVPEIEGIFVSPDWLRQSPIARTARPRDPRKRTRSLMVPTFLFCHPVTHPSRTSFLGWIPCKYIHLWAVESCFSRIHNGSTAGGKAASSDLAKSRHYRAIEWRFRLHSLRLHVICTRAAPLFSRCRILQHHCESKGTFC